MPYSEAETVDSGPLSTDSANQGPARLGTGSALLIAAIVGFLATAATWAISSNVFDGGTNSGNTLAAIAVGISVALALTWFFARHGMGVGRAVTIIVVAWGGGFVLLFFLYFGLYYWGCQDGGCR